MCGYCCLLVEIPTGHAVSCLFSRRGGTLIIVPYTATKSLLAPGYCHVGFPYSLVPMQVTPSFQRMHEKNGSLVYEKLGVAWGRG